MWKECNLIMLPTNEKTNIHKFGDCLDVNAHLQKWHNEAKPKYQYLYITPDDEIKEGDWCVLDNEEVIQISEVKDKAFFKKYEIVVDTRGLVHSLSLCKKIIVTTDSSLKIADFPELENTAYRNLPQIPQSFIEYFIEEYNKGNVISNVLVEYWAHTEEHPQLKINTDNTINIKPIKNSWSREEVIEFGEKCFQAAREFNSQDGVIDIGQCCDLPKDLSPVIFDENKWIEENL